MRCPTISRAQCEASPIHEPWVGFWATSFIFPTVYQAVLRGTPRPREKSFMKHWLQEMKETVTDQHVKDHVLQRSAHCVSISRIHFTSLGIHAFSSIEMVDGLWRRGPFQLWSLHSVSGHITVEVCRVHLSLAITELE